jgi:hypothetical protein
MSTGVLQVDDAKAGFVELTTFPWPSTATHNPVEAHETAVTLF